MYAHLFKGAPLGNKNAAGKRGSKAKLFPDIMGTPDQVVLESLHKKRITGLAPAEQQAVKDYTGEDYHGYEGMNGLLRGVHTEKELDKMQAGAASLSKRNTSILTSVLDDSQLPMNMKTYRGVSDSYAERLRDAHDKGFLVGKTLEDPGFVSASIDPGVAKKWSGDVNIVMDAPKGTKALYVESHTKNKTEREVVFQRGTKMLIRSVEEDVNGRMLVHVQVLGS